MYQLVGNWYAILSSHISTRLTIQTNDNLYVQVHLVSAANIVLCSGGCSTKQGQPGINRFSQPLQVGQTASARVERNGQVIARVDGTNVFSSTPARYNFSASFLT
jgi:hypothetical protein